MSEIIAVTEDNFYREVLKGKMPVLAEFFAAWCGHCKNMAPILKKLSGEYEGKIKICAVDIDKTPQAAAAYAVRAIPTFLLFKDENTYERFSGEMSESALKNKIDNLIKSTR